MNGKALYWPTMALYLRFFAKYGSISSGKFVAEGWLFTSSVNCSLVLSTYNGNPYSK